MQEMVVVYSKVVAMKWGEVVRFCRFWICFEGSQLDLLMDQSEKE